MGHFGFFVAAMPPGLLTNSPGEKRESEKIGLKNGIFVEVFSVTKEPTSKQRIGRRGRIVVEVRTNQRVAEQTKRALRIEKLSTNGADFVGVKVIGCARKPGFEPNSLFLKPSK